MTTRQESINALCAVWHIVDVEFCCTTKERKDSEKEMRKALYALGVTDAEIDD